ncbi:MAG: hypothetical protein ABGX87_01420 [Alcanivorax sp.]|uniref:Secreted protein n=1 Tax=Alloalcanivorax marinus TaxID=1177169 RepID=A0A9Q3UP05_9GAMM|nr:hypothetical protein [Alloalcanivorax marinus]MBM7333072.1 hypothetical protein [Alloalcanivorax marinus]MCC4309725.1 hypothetical protein [Alloalcanivorax marinus]
MAKRWITSVLVLFLAVNGLVVAGDSASHASHDAPGTPLHAQGNYEDNIFSSSQHHGDCEDGHHCCHSHANFAPLFSSRVLTLPTNNTTWPLGPQSGAVLSGRQPPVPPPNTAFFQS